MTYFAVYRARRAVPLASPNGTSLQRLCSCPRWKPCLESSACDCRAAPVQSFRASHTLTRLAAMAGRLPCEQRFEYSPLVRVGHRLPASDLFERAKTSFAIAGLRIQAAYVYAGRAERLLHFGVRQLRPCRFVSGQTETQTGHNLKTAHPHRIARKPIMHLCGARVKCPGEQRGPVCSQSVCG